jgi:hypothetical protein
MVNPQSLEEGIGYRVRVKVALTGHDAEKNLICEFRVIDSKFVVDATQLTKLQARIPAVELAPMHLFRADSKDQVPFVYESPLTIPDQVID